MRKRQMWKQRENCILCACVFIVRGYAHVCTRLRNSHSLCISTFHFRISFDPYVDYYSLSHCCELLSSHKNRKELFPPSTVECIFDTILLNSCFIDMVRLFTFSLRYGINILFNFRPHSNITSLILHQTKSFSEWFVKVGHRPLVIFLKLSYEKVHFHFLLNGTFFRNFLTLVFTWHVLCVYISICCCICIACFLNKYSIL